MGWKDDDITKSRLWETRIFAQSAQEQTPCNGRGCEFTAQPVNADIIRCDPELS
jgi:hypothetical protein